MLSNATIVRYIPVADLARARKFYEEKMRLKPKRCTRGVSSANVARLLGVHVSISKGHVQSQYRFSEVDDVGTEVAELKARGVVFEEYDMSGD